MAGSTGVIMKVLTTEEQEQVCEALRLSSIYLQEHPDNDSPIREVGRAWT